MGVSVEVEWISNHDVEPPAGESEEAFEERLNNGDEAAWEHAMDQTDSSTAATQNWRVAGGSWQ